MFSILFVFLFVRPVRNVYSLAVVSTAIFLPCFVVCEVQRKGSLNYFEERLGRGYIFNKIRGILIRP